MNASARIKRLGSALMFTLFLPGGTAMATEEPDFKVIQKSGALEVREYPPLIAAEVVVGGDRGQAVNAGFRLLAGYIFGGNTRRQSIAMTAPVVQAPARGESIAMTAPVVQTGANGTWTVRFIMPRGYTLDTLPTPNDQRVHLIPLPAARMAVVRFSGLAHEPDIQEKTTELRAFLAAQQLVAAGPPSLARYNPPWTLWFMRRNEIMIPVQGEAAR
jgi:hypothetical protein